MSGITVSGRLFVDVISAHKLPSMDVIGSSDPFVVVKVGENEVGKTKTVDDNNNPVWKAELHFDVEVGIGDSIFLEVYDYDRVTRNDFIGKVTIPFQTIRTYRVDEEKEELTVKLDGPKCKNDTTLTYYIAFKRYAFDDEMARLEEVNEKLKSNLNQLEEENARLKKTTEALRHDTDALKTANHDLSENVSKFSEENKRLTSTRQELEVENQKYGKLNTQLKDNVDKFQEQNGKLKSIVDRLSEENDHFKHEVEKLSDSISSLESVKQTLEEFAASNQQDVQSIIHSINKTLDEQRTVVKAQKQVVEETEANTKKQERLLLLQLHAQCQFQDQAQGMDNKEFTLWKNLIPKKYLQSPVGLEFNKIDRDRDGVINMQEFTSLVDQLIQSVN